jgi:hypothetical protein
MSIHPPSDIVLDVVKAADPARYKAAVERLTRIAAPDATSPANASFDSLIAPAGIPQDGTDTSADAGTNADGTRKSSPAEAAKAYRGFEAMTLATFIEQAMPDDDSAVYGSGMAGGVWKSMLAEQIADQMAKAGGIGIASQLSAFEKAAAGAAGVSGTTPAAAHVGPTSSNESPFDPRLLVMTFERGFAGRVGADPTATDDSKPSG